MGFLFSRRAPRDEQNPEPGRVDNFPARIVKIHALQYYFRIFCDRRFLLHKNIPSKIKNAGWEVAAGFYLTNGTQTNSGSKFIFQNQQCDQVIKIEFKFLRKIFFSIDIYLYPHKSGLRALTILLLVINVKDLFLGDLSAAEASELTALGCAFSVLFLAICKVFQTWWNFWNASEQSWFFCFRIIWHRRDCWRLLQKREPDWVPAIIIFYQINLSSAQTRHRWKSSLFPFSYLIYEAAVPNV